MIYNATRAIEAEFKKNDLKYRVREVGNTSCLEASVGGKNCSGIELRFISTDDDNDVAIRILSFVRVPESKRGAVLEAINELQRRFRYVNFSVDDDGDLHIGYDLPLHTENVGEVAMEMFIRMVKIADDAYPVLMRALWS